MGLFSSDNSRHLKKLRKIADRVEGLEAVYKPKTDEQLRACTAEFKERLSSGETLDQILPDAFACVREAGIRVLGQRAFYVQLLGGITLHQGRIAELKTGEGKTLTSVLAAYLNALAGKGVHIVEVNEYLAKRNMEWMGKVHRFLGLTVGYSRSQAAADEKREAYACDITYVTSSELGFDYLRDNVAHSKEERVQRSVSLSADKEESGARGFYFCIVDEADSILIDESRTPLIMSSRTKDNSDMYKTADRFAKSLREADYEVDLKERAVRLTETGIEKAERFFSIDNISGAEHMELNHFINNALRAHLLFELNADYLINKDKEVIIVDSYTGRMMIGRRYSDGLHQAIEAKEGVPIRNEDKTVATVTIQNLFKLYSKLSGMTGTAKTEEQEFQKIYGVDVVSIPTNMPIAREDAPDVVFTALEQKYAAILEDVLYRYERGQPVLIGTTTIDKSEEISKILKTKKVTHVVLNAKNHEQEGDIVAQAGKLGSVTIATNMAGRGTDIQLGGNPEYLAKQQLKKEGLDDKQIYDATSYHETKDPEVLASRKKFRELLQRFTEQTEEEKKKVVDLGGLHIIGTERHDSRRIDNQLRGRSGRQGDPGSTIFYISCEDEMIKRFGKSIIGNMLRFAVGDGMQSRMLTRMFERVQKAVEGHYFDARRNTFEYDNVMNDQRELIYKERNRILDGEDVHKQILNMFPAVVSKIVAEAIDTDKMWHEWDLNRANQVLGSRLFGQEVAYLDKENTGNADYTEIEKMVLDAVIEQYEEKSRKLTEQGIPFGQIERDILLQIVDTKWMDHIDAMVQLRQGIGLRGYGQRDPLIEFRRESGAMFNEMVDGINEQAALFLFKVKIEVQRKVTPQKTNTSEFVPGQGREINRGPVTAASSTLGPVTAGPQKTFTNIKKDVGRNDPCPCGSGKKYKNCCGA